jgi:hypothetical protein
MFDCENTTALPLASYPGVTVPFVCSHHRTTRPPAAYVLVKRVFRVESVDADVGTSFAKSTHATLRPLANFGRHAVEAPASEPVLALDPEPDPDPASDAVLESEDDPSDVLWPELDVNRGSVLDVDPPAPELEAHRDELD